MKGTKILIIEDTKSIRDELNDILTFEGMNVITAEDGQIGIDLAKTESPEIILCDIMMPKKDGYQVYHELKHSILHETPFIFLTAKATTDNIREGMILGADDYIAKPFDIDLLINSIKTRLDKNNKREKVEKDRRKTLQTNISQAIPHELLTPLNAIMGLSKICMEKNDFNEKTLKEFSTAIFESGQRLHNTIKKFIYYTEIELLINNPEKHAALKNEVVDMGSFLVTQQSKLISEKYNRKSDLKLNLVPFSVKTSYSHLEIILSNILDNAFKFSNPGEKVEVDVIKEAGFVKINILDYGIGMDLKTGQEIDAFSQFDREKMEQQGLGLGLITCKKLIEFYGGKLNWKLNKNKGTIFEISLLY